MKKRNDAGSGVYILEFDPPYVAGGNGPQAGKKVVRYYIGWAANIIDRLHTHRAGKGAKMTQVAVEAGCKINLVKIFPGEDRHFEKRLRNWHKTGDIVAKNGFGHRVEPTVEVDFYA